MTTKVIYVDPGTLLDIRVCDPVFDMTPCRATWEMSMSPQKVLVDVVDAHLLGVPFDVSVRTSLSNAPKPRDAS